MRWIIPALLVALLGAACGEPIYRSGLDVRRGTSVQLADVWSVPETRPEWNVQLSQPVATSGVTWQVGVVVGLAALGERIAVLDEANHALATFNRETGQITEVVGGIGQGALEFLYPRRLVGMSGSVAVFDRGNRRLQFIDENGVHLGEVPLPDDETFAAVAGDADSVWTLWYVDEVYRLRRHACCGASGDTAISLGKLRRPEQGPVQMVAVPGRLVLGIDSDIYVFARDGELLTFGRLTGEGDMVTGITALAAAGQGNRVVAATAAPLFVCLSLDDLQVLDQRRRPATADSAFATVTALYADAAGLYTYEPAEARLSRWRLGCSGEGIAAR